MSKQLTAFKKKTSKQSSTSRQSSTSKQSSISPRAMSFKLCYLNELGPDSPSSTMIRVRIVKMFQDYLVNEDTKFGIGYIFVDEKQNYMQAKLTPHYESTFKHRLQEQGVYEISNFRVHSRPGEYNTVKHNDLITFKRDTYIRTIKKSMCNLPTTKPFEFVAFEAIPSMVTIDQIIIKIKTEMNLRTLRN
ncbi:hypothetical protein ACHQM5_007499 [Ranunculus cassubicifolius]